MATEPDIAIIGPGKVGTAIGVLAARAGWRVVALAGRRAKRAELAAERIGGPVRVCTPEEAAGAANLVLLTVSDEAIEELCGELAKGGHFRADATVAHCSGAMSSESLAPARTFTRCRVGSLHPLQTFPTVERSLHDFAGTYCFIEGDAGAVSVLEQLARAIRGRPVRVDSAGKALYHAAAAMACNHLAGLVDAALRMCEQAGIPNETARDALGPLVRATAENVVSLGPQEALTGPIARGDVGTIERHLQAMAATSPEIACLYRAAARWTVDLARRKGTIDDAAADALRECLDSGKEN